MPATASGWLNNRWTIALGGAMFMMTLGTIYSWSLFAQPLLACFGWSSTTVTWTFALAIFSLGTGAVIGGRRLAVPDLRIDRGLRRRHGIRDSGRRGDQVVSRTSRSGRRNGGHGLRPGCGHL